MLRGRVHRSSHSEVWSEFKLVLNWVELISFELDTVRFLFLDISKRSRKLKALSYRLEHVYHTQGHVKVAYVLTLQAQEVSQKHSGNTSVAHY